MTEENGGRLYWMGRPIEEFSKEALIVIVHGLHAQLAGSRATSEALAELAQFAARKQISMTDEQQKLIDLVIERAEQACQYALKRQEFDDNCSEDFRSGWEVAVDVCVGAIRRHVMQHIADDLTRAATDAEGSKEEQG
jgi:hypothetical protein